MSRLARTLASSEIEPPAGADPADPQAAPGRLAQRPDGDDGAAGVERAERRRQRRGRRGAARRTSRRRPAAFPRGRRRARGRRGRAALMVRPVGLWKSATVTASGGAAGGERRLPRVDVPAGRRQRDGERACARGADRRQRARIGGRVDQHAVARAGEQREQQVQRVLGAGGDQHLVGARVQAARGQARRRSPRAARGRRPAS